MRANAGRIVWIIILFVCLIIDIVQTRTLLSPHIESTEVSVKSELSDIESLESGTVVKVIDGDTFVVDINNKQTTIRLIGVDTPESVHSDESKNTQEGFVASDYTKTLLLNETVYLEYDVTKTDIYGRTLAYAYLSNGEMVQDILLEKGMARVMTVQPNSKYADRFLKIEKKAQKEEVGFWNGIFGGN